MTGCGCGGTGPTCKTNQNLILNLLLPLSTFLAAYTINLFKRDSPQLDKHSIFTKSIALGALSIGVYKSYNYFYPTIQYKPVTNSNGRNTLDSREIIIGTSDEDNFITCYKNGSKVWAKGGVNYIIASPGTDIFYFSLCSTKIIGGLVNTIYGFDPLKDQLKFFCTKREIKPQDIAIKHITHEKNTFTCVEVSGSEYISPVCLAGELDLKATDIILTTIGTTQQELGA